MESLKVSKTVNEGLVESEENGNQNLVSSSFTFREEKCVKSKAVTDPCNVESYVGSSSYRDVKGISLFVELTGGLTDKLDKEIICDVKGALNGESICEVKGGELLRETEAKVNVGQQGFKANLGDFVWVIIKKDTWWSGRVCDASTAPKEVGKVKTSKDGILVRCFGNGNYLWCLDYHLKPFVGSFEELSKHSNSRRFLDALDKAVVEFRCRVKNEFSCPCSSKTVVEKRGDIGDFSVSRFEPKVFLDYIKDLASDIYMPSKFDYIAKKECLSAFYRSIGHLEIPLDELMPVNSGTPSKVKKDVENGHNKNGIQICRKGVDLKGRRKSRLLTYPGECEIEESKVDVNGGVDLSNTNGQSVKKLKRGRKKKTVHENVCTSDVLLELQYAGQDCSFPYKSKNFDWVERFITGFRKWAFKDEIVINQTHQILQGSGMQKTVDMVGKDSTSTKKGRKKKDKSVISPMLGTDPNRVSMILDFQNGGSHNLEPQSMANKRTEVTANQGLQNNGASTFLNFGPTPCKLEPKRRKKISENNKCTAASNNNMNAPQNVNGHVEQLNQAAMFRLANLYGSTPLCFTGNYGVPQVGSVPAGLAPAGPWPAGLAPFGHFPAGLVPFGHFPAGHLPASLAPAGLFPAGLAPAGLSHEPKKRGRKRKNMDLQANVGSTIIPNSNENGPEMKNIKRSNKNKETGVACIDLSYNKVQQGNEEVKGTAFLLKFSPDHPLPPKEILNTVFCKYGPLNESETQVSTENRSGQVVFLDSSSAGEAFWGLQNDQPFGPALVNYRIQHLSDSKSVIGFKTPIKSPPPVIDPQATSGSTIIPDLNGNAAENILMEKTKSFDGNAAETTPMEKTKSFDGNVAETIPMEKTKSFDGNAAETILMEKTKSFDETRQSSLKKIPLGLKPPQNGETPDLAGIKKNLEMMTLMMEKAGDTLSPEMRAKLESEIKGLMNKFKPRNFLLYCIEREHQSFETIGLCWRFYIMIVGSIMNLIDFLHDSENDIMELVRSFTVRCSTGAASTDSVATDARLVLEDGSIWKAKSFGASGTQVGEVVFNTSLTGYQEILTDPSYAGQFVLMTCPHIGNTGVNIDDEESIKCFLASLVIRSLSISTSNYRSTESLSDYLSKRNIMGIYDVDTRAITRQLREEANLVS
ncbi:putative PWWP domain-containing protein [Tanacetum coccineum]